jgi:hypothetical protein
LILPDGSEFARVDFPRDVFALIERAASEMKVTLGQFFLNALREACKRRGVFTALERRAA